MRRPPPLADFPRYPIVGGTILLSIGVTLAWWAKVDVSILFEDPRVRRGEVWRLLTSALLHADVLHLVFNAYWIWIFGTLIEDAFGHLSALLLIIVLAAGSGAAEYAILEGGVGLSGVGYGFFAFLWALSRRDARFREAIDQRTITLFVAWFFICIAGTFLQIMPVANIAHGTGALLGGLIGIAVASRGMGRVAATIATGLFSALFIGGALFARPWINLSEDRGTEEFRLGYDALQADDNAQAIRWFLDATIMRPRDPSIWYDLGIAYDRLGEDELSRSAFEKASRYRSNDPQFSQEFGKYLEPDATTVPTEENKRER